MKKESLRIKCPNCSAILTIKYIPAIESKSINCPVCKTTNKYQAYRSLEEKAAPDKSKEQNQIGQLQLLNTEFIYQLKEGLNVIGRKAKTSMANIQIDSSDRTMSRSHVIVDVCRFTNNHLHYISNSNNTNPTFINGILIEAGDKMVLKGGEIIKMGNVLVKFVLDSDNETEY
ncbi:MAG: FHA domain-containing protein [Rikenellaceae bacterium]